MAQQQVVIGSGPDGLRVAALLAARGDRVTLLQQGPGPSGLARPEIPEGDGRWRLRTQAGRAGAGGGLIEVAAPTLGVARDGRVHALPLAPRTVGQLLPDHGRRDAARSWLRARGRNAMAELLGGGQEERTHRDWVVRRMGAPAWSYLYADYAARRWGLPSDELGVSLARTRHFVEDAGPFSAPGPDALAAAAARVADVRSDCRIADVRLQDGRVAAVGLADGAVVPVDGRLWVDDTPVRVTTWLGDAAPEGLHNDATRLAHADARRVVVAGLRADLPDVVHLLDDGATGWRVVSLGGGRGVVDVTLPIGGPPPPDAALAAAAAGACRASGLGDARVDGGVESLRAYVPVWQVTTHAVLREVLGPLDGLGIVLCGRRGAVAALDPGEALDHAGALASGPPPDQREVQRQLVLPPVRLDDLGARITRFVTR